MTYIVTDREGNRTTTRRMTEDEYNYHYGKRDYPSWVYSLGSLGCWVLLAIALAIWL